MNNNIPSVYVDIITYPWPDYIIGFHQILVDT